MDSLNIANIKAKKANTIKKQRQLQKIASLFRLVEICLFLAFISRFSFPVAVKNSGAYFKDLTIILVSPRFVFVLGNVIVITLYAKSGHFSGRDSTEKNSETDLYQEFVEKSGKSIGINRYEYEYRGKQSTCVQHSVIADTCAPLESKKYQRSQSDIIKRANVNNPCRELSRSLTEKCGKTPDSGEEWAKHSYPEDNMSNDEFRCTIEAFIARQKRFRRDEELCVID